MTTLWAMARYEALMHWRRGGLSVGIALLCLVTMGLAALQFSSWQEQNLSAVFDAQTPRDAITVQVIISLQIALAVIALVLLVMSSESVPLDRQFKVQDVLDSLPLTRAMYLMGKVFGLMLILMLHLLIAVAIIGIGLWLMIGEFHPNAYLAFWVGTGLPVTMLTAICGLLLGSFHPTRRRAILFCIPFSIYVYAYVLTRISILMTISAALVPDLPMFRMMTIPLLTMSLEALLAEIALQLIGLWGAAWLWLKWREGR